MTLNLGDDTAQLEKALESRRVMVLATAGEAGMHCTPLFFVPINGGRSLLFLSKSSTLHSRQIAGNPVVAACCFSDDGNTFRTFGVQVTGVVSRPDGEVEKKCHEVYFSKYPMARLIVNSSHQLYCLEVQTAKLVDNRFSFGRSFFWDFRKSTP